MARISILFVIDGLEFGGGERVFLQLAAGLKDRYQVFVAAMPGGSLENELKRLTIQFLPIDISRRVSLKPIRQIKDIIQSKKIDLVHSQGARADFFARVAGKLARVPHILCTIAMPVEGFDVGPLRKKIYRFMDWLSERYVERFIVVSDSLKKALIQGRGMSTQRVVKIYNGIELDQFHPDVRYGSLRKEWGISGNVPLIGAIGRMVWQKGFEFLIEATPQIVDVIPESRFMLVGEGPLRERLEALAERLKVKNSIIFTGFRSDINEILSAIDMLVVPSLLEGFPMITLEAMAMAKPIVATNIDGITEQITHGKNGILVPPKDPDAIAEAVIRVLADRECAKAMTLAARKKVEKEFSVEEMVAETERVYMSLLKGNHSVSLSRYL